MNHHKVTPKFGICIGCEEPTLTSNMTHDGYCADCEQKRMEDYYSSRIAEARYNNRHAVSLNSIFETFK